MPSYVEDHSRTLINPSHSLNIGPLNFHGDLVESFEFSYALFSSTSVFTIGVPSDDVVLCSSTLDSSLVMNEEQPIDGVGVAQLTCAVIHEEYEWELEHQHSAKDDSLLSEPPSFFPNIFGEPAIHDFACVSSSMGEPIVDHSHDSLDVSISFDNGEDKLLIENPLDPSYVFFGNTIG